MAIFVSGSLTIKGCSFDSADGDASAPLLCVSGYSIALTCWPCIVRLPVRLLCRLYLQPLPPCPLLIFRKFQVGWLPWVGFHRLISLLMARSLYIAHEFGCFVSRRRGSEPVPDVTVVVRLRKMSELCTVFFSLFYCTVLTLGLLFVLGVVENNVSDSFLSVFLNPLMDAKGASNAHFACVLRLWMGYRPALRLF
jgi:hypothetical protein